MQKLRQWQLQQQERLLKHQQIQREMLTQEQDCICKALELSLQELDVDGSISRKNNLNESEGSTETNNKELSAYNNSWEKRSSIEMMNNSESSVSQYTNDFECIIPRRSPAEKLVEKVVDIDSRTKEQCKGKAMSDIKVILTLPSPRREKDVEHFIIDGVAPLPSIETIINHSIDDIPIPSPKKDFHTLLEERLKDSETKPSERADNAPVNKVKKPFLRKGEGLNRFKLNRKLQVPAIKKKLRSASFSVNTHSDSKHSKGEPKYSHTTRPLKNTQPTRNAHHTAVSQKRLSLKDVPLPKKKVRSKSESSTSVTRLENGLGNVKNVGDLNTSDFQSRTQKEMEEVRIFELLEEKAENSSFCSTSSTVLAFLQQSTPFKAKKKGRNTKDCVVNVKQPSPIIKHPEAQATSNKNNDSYYNFASFVSKTALQDAKENNKMDTDIKRQALLKSQVQSMHSQGDSYDCSNVENNNEADVSLHVRFSEYNEYKTIGLTDTSSISTDSFLINNLSDEKVWDDTLTPEISDTETVSLPIEELRSPMIVEGNIQNNNCASKFEQCNMQEELNYEGKSLGNTRQENDFNCNEDTNRVAYNDESEYSDVSDQSPDDEQSALHEYNKKNLTSQDINAFYGTKESPKSLEKCGNRKADKCVGNSNNVIVIEDQKDQGNLQEMNDTVFKSELLKSRLVELEQEINIFRKETTALSIQRKKLQEDHRTLHKEFSEKEKMLEENRKQAEDRLQEERKKLAREKTALESRMRDAQEKAQQSKLERQELQSLKQEIDKLRDEMHVKESRWNAAQSRHKCQMRVLKMENLKLKQEVERLQSLKKTNVRSKGKPGTYSNTKAIHQINKQLSAQGKESKKSHDNSSSDDDSDQKLVEPTMKATGMADAQNIEEARYNCVGNKSVINEKLQKSQTSMVNIARKRNLYENLIKEATSDMIGVQEHLHTSENISESNSELRDKLKNLNRGMNTLEDEAERTNGDSDVASSNHPNDNVPLRMENDYAHFISPTKMSLKNHSNKLPSISPNESSLNAHTKATSSSCQNSSKIDKQDVRQIQHPDGRIEYWYSNGNVKKIFPDQGLTKLIYYNGDVRETNTDGKVRYFYASTHTWHTTMPDGLEVLEFADGQVERRLQTGTVEVSFPDGSVRVLDSDGSEKWTLPDGTLIQTFINGEKILTLPNGQQEIHTKDHKRREYPDGTVKLIYPDGTQETRYSNGRIRLKDRDGNLLMDSYQ